ncbi:MAG: hypothetical protein AVDCRST_MAG35-1177, partial [uncultured Quadrisphaera sp.]
MDALTAALAGLVLGLLVSALVLAGLRRTRRRAGAGP